MREISIRIQDGRTLSERGVPETLGDGGSQKTVVLPRLLGESEETEKDERAKDSSPSSELEYGGVTRLQGQHGPGYLNDMRVIPVGVSPRDPGLSTQQSVGDDSPDG